MSQKLLKLASLYAKAASLTLTQEEKGYIDIDRSKGIIGLKEDPIRTLRNNPLLILRIIQLAAENEMDVQESVIEAAKSQEVQKSLLKHRKEIWDKLSSSVFASENPGEAAELFSSFGLRDIFFTVTPEQLREIGLEETPLVSWEINPHSSHHDLSLWQHSLATLKGMTNRTKKKVRKEPSKFAIRNLAAIFHDIGKRYAGIHEWNKNNEEGKSEKKFDQHAEVSEKLARKILSELGAPNNIIDAVCGLVVHHMDEHKIVHGKKKERKTLIQKLVDDLSDEDDKKEILKNLIDLAKSDISARTSDRESTKKYDKLEKKLEKKLL